MVLWENNEALYKNFNIIHNVKLNIHKFPTRLNFSQLKFMNSYAINRSFTINNITNEK